MDYGIKPIEGHRWRRKLVAEMARRRCWWKEKGSIADIGGVGILPGSVDAGSAAAAAMEVARSVFGGSGRVVSLLFAGRSNVGGPWGLKGKVWKAIVEVLPAGNGEEDKHASAACVGFWVTEGSVSGKDMPVGRFPRRPVDPIGTRDKLRCVGMAEAMEAIERNQTDEVRECEENLARNGKFFGCRRHLLRRSG